MNPQDFNSDLRQFAGNLIDGVIRTVSENKCDGLSFEHVETTSSEEHTQRHNVNVNISESKT